jgi:hypothetical protein
MKLSTVATIVGMALLVAGCDKCGNWELTGLGMPKTCTDVKPRG